MYKFNSKLVVRENDKSVFSLDNMEIYEFNEAGFNAILIVRDADEAGITYQEWYEKAKDLPNFIDEDLEEFWQNLVKYKIVIKVVLETINI